MTAAGRTEGAHPVPQILTAGAPHFALVFAAGFRAGSALACLLVAEFTVVLRFRGLTIGEYFASRDPVGGLVYVVMLGRFAVVPLLGARSHGAR